MGYDYFGDDKYGGLYGERPSRVFKFKHYEDQVIDVSVYGIKTPLINKVRVNTNAESYDPNNESGIAFLNVYGLDRGFEISVDRTSENAWKASFFSKKTGEDIQQAILNGLLKIV